MHALCDISKNELDDQRSDSKCDFQLGEQEEAVLGFEPRMSRGLCVRLPLNTIRWDLHPFAGLGPEDGKPRQLAFPIRLQAGRGRSVRAWGPEVASVGSRSDGAQASGGLGVVT